MLIRIDNITLRPDQDESLLTEIAEKKLRTSLKSVTILKKSLDARDKGAICYRYRILAETEDENFFIPESDQNIKEYIPRETAPAPRLSAKKKVIIIGAGPAGLFSALRLIESGAEVTLLERGKKIEERMKDISILESRGILDPESNVLFGEGGAGTYSDGKLTTRINRPEIMWFYDRLIENGAPPETAWQSKPHIGTDRLRIIMKNIREKINSSGSQILFSEKVSELIISEDRILGVRASSGKEYMADAVIAATGHSARDTYEMFRQNGIDLEKKGFAIGSRIEHPAELIRNIQYGKSRYRQTLPAAEYSLTFNNRETGRGTYSFCMCPGGTVINSSSEPGRLCTNGMSFSDRKGPFSNSAIVVTVRPEDTGPDPLAGIELQRQIEEKAFAMGGGEYCAPAQTVYSFMEDCTDHDLPETSYTGGVRASQLNRFLPSFITVEIKKALVQFNKRMKGFISPSAVFIGAETRTSSPVRITRSKNYQSLNRAGLFPAGEGAGYAGGIVSSAVDGIRCADHVTEYLSLK